MRADPFVILRNDSARMLPGVALPDPAPPVPAPRHRPPAAWLLATTILSAVIVAHPMDAARAQQAASPPVALPNIVVSPTSVPTPSAEIASSVTVITAADIENQQRRTVPDVLSTVPGLNVVQAGGPGGQTSVFVRGTNSNHTKVLIDGIEVSDPSNPGRTFDFGQLLTADIERIEVLRGPQSGLYGADAIGGVISIVTKKGEGPAKAVGRLEGGSFGTFNQTANVSGSQDRFNYAFNVAHFRASDTPVTPLALVPLGRIRNDDSYDNVTVSTKLGADVSENLTFNAVARYTDARLDYTGTDFSTFPATAQATRSYTLTHQFFTRGEAVLSAFDGRWKNYFGVNYADHWNFNKTPDTAFGPSPATVNTGERVKYDWRSVAALAPGQTLVTGLEREDERLRTAVTRAANGNTGGYVELQSSALDRIFLVTNVRRDENDSFGGATTYRVAPAVLVPGTETKLKASAGTGFKAPTLNQLYVDFPDFGFFANRNLQPEESFGYDAGFEQPLFDNRVRVGATYFHNDITNLIDSNPTFTTNINIGHAEISGVEAFGTIALSERVRLRGDYTYTDARNAVTDMLLLRRPRNKASLTASWNATDALLLSATILHVGEFADVSRATSAPLTAPGYTIVNVAADYQLDARWKVFGRVDNLFDEHYQDPTGFLRPGIGVFAGVQLANR